MIEQQHLALNGRHQTPAKRVKASERASEGGRARPWEKDGVTRRRESAIDGEKVCKESESRGKEGCCWTGKAENSNYAPTGHNTTSVTGSFRVAAVTRSATAASSLSGILAMA